MENKINQYITEHTTPENSILYELNRQTHIKMLMPRMLSGHVQGRFLSMISHMIKPKCILEIGTFTGYSALCLAEGLTDDGILHTIEINDELEDFIVRYIKKSGLEDKIKLHIGDALKIIPELPCDFDLVFIDGDKRQYPEYFSIVADKVKKGGFIIADNVLWDGKVINNSNEKDKYTAGVVKFNDIVHKDKRFENVILSLRDGLMIIRKRE